MRNRLFVAVVLATCAIGANATSYYLKKPDNPPSAPLAGKTMSTMSVSSDGYYNDVTPHDTPMGACLEGMAYMKGLWQTNPWGDTEPTWLPEPVIGSGDEAVSAGASSWYAGKAVCHLASPINGSVDLNMLQTIGKDPDFNEFLSWTEYQAMTAPPPAGAASAVVVMNTAANPVPVVLPAESGDLQSTLHRIVFGGLLCVCFGVGFVGGRQGGGGS